MEPISRADISRQLSELRVELISTKNKLRALSKTPIWDEVVSKDKYNIESILQDLSNVIEYMRKVESKFSRIRMFNSRYKVGTSYNE